jgi:hypothetical protein
LGKELQGRLPENMAPQLNALPGPEKAVTVLNTNMMPMEINRT